MYQEKIDKDPAERHRLFSLARENVLTLKEISSLLGLSYRQTQRIWDDFLESGHNIDSFYFKRKHPAWNKIDMPYRERIIELKNLYPHINNCHMADILEEETGQKIHPSTIRNILIESGKYPPPYEPKRRPRKRFEKEQAGELAQMDTSQHRWLSTSEKDIYLIVVMDDYSRAILAARIFDANTTWNNMLVIRETIQKYGLFKILYTDNASMFKLIRRHISRHFEYKADLENIQTQIHRALGELGIVLLPHAPFQPQCKGKIERLFGFMQDRFLHTAKDCQDLEELNNVLQKWICWYNTKHVHSITEVVPQERLTKNIFSPIPKNINLDDVFCLKESRTVKNDNTFEFQGTTYQITNISKRISWAKTNIQLHIIPDKYIRIFYKGNFIQQFPCKNVPCYRTFLLQN